MPVQKLSPTENFSAAEFEAASDGREAEGAAWDRPDDVAADQWSAGGDEIDGIASAGDSLVVAIERDILGIDPGVQWTAEDDALATDAINDAEAIIGALESDLPDDARAAGVGEVLEARAERVADAAHHLTGILTDGSDRAAATGNAENGAERDTDGAASMAQEIGRVNSTSKDIASIMVNGLRSNVGISAAGGATTGMINYA